MSNEALKIEADKICQLEEQRRLEVQKKYLVDPITTAIAELDGTLGIMIQSLNDMCAQLTEANDRLRAWELTR